MSHPSTPYQQPQPYQQVPPQKPMYQQQKYSNPFLTHYYSYHMNEKNYNMKKDIPKPKIDRQAQAKTIKSTITNYVKQTLISISSTKTDCKDFIGLRHHYNLENFGKGLKDFEVPEIDEEEEDIFSLYFSVPKKEAEEKRKEEERERLRKQEEEKQKAIIRAQLIKEGKNPNLIPRERTHLSPEKLDKVLGGFQEGDKQVLELCIKSMKSKGKISISQLEELNTLPICKEAPEYAYQTRLLAESKFFRYLNIM